MSKYTTKLTINVHSFRDASRFRNTGENIPNLTSCQILNDKNEIIDMYQSKISDEYSSFYQELNFILKALTEFYPLLSGDTIEICCSELAIPKLITKLNTVSKYLKSWDGKVAYKSLSTGDFVDHLIHDHVIFDPRIKSIDLIKWHLSKLIPLIASHAISSINIQCKKYYPKSIDRKSELSELKIRYNHQHELVRKVLLVGDIKLGLSLEDTTNEIKNRRDAWTKNQKF